MKEKILITGATGNVGRAIIKHLDTDQFDIDVAVRDIDKAKNQLGRDDISYFRFDIENQIGFEKLDLYNGIFLLRPPQIGDVPKYFKPLVKILRKSECTKLIFLSVQGAEKMSYIPHHKIEKLIAECDLPYIFLRPSYFMDNLITTLFDELKLFNRIYMPSGRLRFNWIDVDDIGKAVAKIFSNSSSDVRTAYTLTNSINYNFYEIIEKINLHCGTNFQYISPDPFSFIYTMRKRGNSFGYIGILLLLHFLPRFGKKTEITNDFNKLTGENPRTIEDFLISHKACFKSK